MRFGIDAKNIPCPPVVSGEAVSGMVGVDTGDTDSDITFYILNPNQITQTTCAPDGQVGSTTDPAGLTTADTYNLAGQMTQQIAVDTGGAETSHTNIPTDYTYNGDDEVLTMTAVMPTGTPSQTTAYTYGVNTSSGSDLFSNDLLYEVQYPDATTGDASTSSP